MRVSTVTAPLEFVLTKSSFQNLPLLPDSSANHSSQGHHEVQVGAPASPFGWLSSPAALLQGSPGTQQDMKGPWMTAASRTESFGLREATAELRG